MKELLQRENYIFFVSFYKYFNLKRLNDFIFIYHFFLSHT